MSARRAELLGALAEIEVVTGERAVRSLVRRVRARVESGGAPAVALVGRAGAGKTSLLEALTGRRTSGAREGEVLPWTVPAVPGLIWLDAPGFRGSSPWTGCAAALAAWRPAAVVFVAQATEAGALGDDVEVLRGFLGTIAHPRCLVVVNKVDELDPIDDHVPPFTSPRKAFHIAESSARARYELARRGVETVDVVPVSALVVRRGGAVLHEGRWNLGALAPAMSLLARSIPQGLGRLHLAEDLRALAELHAAEAANFEHDGRREVAAGRLARLFGQPAEAMWWQRGLWRRRWFLAGLAGASPDLEDLGGSAPGREAEVNHDRAAGG